MQDADRTTKWRWLEYAAMGIMAASAAVTTTIGALQIRHLYRREMQVEERERQRAAAFEPRERWGHGAATDMPAHGDGRLVRREEHAQAGGHARGR
jgi:hypothetical protein